MKAKKLFLSALTIGLVIPGMAATASAKDGTGSTPVTYENRNYIPDPDDPDSPEWAVAIPSAINFTDDNKKIDASVELVQLNGGALPTSDVTVTVKSAEGYKLKSSVKPEEALSYKLMYGGKEMSASEMTVAVFTSGGDKRQEGTALLGNDKASFKDTYKDTLTYTVSTTTTK